jgi:hypothetical protein
LAACDTSGSKLKDLPVGSFPSDTNVVEVWTHMAELAEPGLEHETLKKRVGAWDLVIRSREGNSETWREETGASVAKMALGDRYLVEEVQGTINGSPFQGYMLVGYSRLERQYFSVWMDTHSTWPLASFGVRGEDGVLRLAGRLRDVVTPSGRPFHVDETTVSDDELLRETYDTIDGEPVKVLEIRRRRRG